MTNFVTVCPSGEAQIDRGCELVIDDGVRHRWEREQAFLGLARETPDGDFANGGLAALAVDPTVRIAVLPGDPSSQLVLADDPKTVIPQLTRLPRGQQLPYNGLVRGTSSGYVGYMPGEGDRWQEFYAVNWHGGVDFYLGDKGARHWEFAPGSRTRVVFLRECVGSAWGAFDLQRQVNERFQIVGPFRVIVAVADTAGAVLGSLGGGWLEPGSGFFGQTMAIESRVLLSEDLPSWPDEKGVEALALRFGARLDLTFGGPGGRHLDRVGPETGKFNPQISLYCAWNVMGRRS